MRRALFLDRDGVLNVDHGYVYCPTDFQVIDGVFRTLRRAQAEGYALIVVTNQSGIARGYFDQAQYEALEYHMRHIFAEEGITFTDIYHCPHHPLGIVPEFSIECDCRKPRPGMILRAAREHDIDLALSIMVGDKESDEQAARSAGVGDIFIVHPPARGLCDLRIGTAR